MSPQWLLRLTRGGFVGFLARWWWGRRRAGAPLRLWLRRAWVAAVADRELLQLGGVFRLPLLIGYGSGVL